MKDKEKENREILLFIACAWTFIFLLIHPAFSLLSIIVIFIAPSLFEKLEKEYQKENRKQN